MIGAVGQDTPGKSLIDCLTRQGIETAGVEILEGSTATNEMIVDNSGERHSGPGSWKGGVLDSFRLKPEHVSIINQHEIWATPGHGENFLRLLVSVYRYP